MGSIGDMLKFKLPYDSKHVATHANHVSNIGRLIGDAFEKEITAELGLQARDLAGMGQIHCRRRRVDQSRGRAGQGRRGGKRRSRFDGPGQGGGRCL